MGAPLVTVGMTTFNGGRFVASSLESILAQDYPNLEVVISDNASTDTTDDIIRAHARRDPRIRYSRNSMNLGSLENARRVLQKGSGEYFLFASDHDLWAPDFVSRCAKVLNDDATVVLAYPRTMLIDGEGTSIAVMPDRFDTRGMEKFERYCKLVDNLRICNMIYGVIRRRALDKVALTRRLLGGDHLVLAALSLEGAFAQLDEVLFFRRENRPSETREETKRRVIEHVDPEKGTKRGALAATELFRELRSAHILLIARSDLPLLQKLGALEVTLHAFERKFQVDRPLVRRLRHALKLAWRIARGGVRSEGG